MTSQGVTEVGAPKKVSLEQKPKGRQRAFREEAMALKPMKLVWAVRVERTRVRVVKWVLGVTGSCGPRECESS